MALSFRHSPHLLPRRQFLTTLASGVAAWLFFPLRRLQAKKVGMHLAQIKALQVVGGAALVTIKGHDMLLIRDSKTTVRAINPMCTHKKCLVHYKPDVGTLACQCHKSAFGLDGSVKGGPAPRALEVYPSQLRGDQIVIALPES